MGATHARPVHRGELLGALSLVSDLGMGQPMEHALRQGLIGMRLGARVGLDTQQLDDVRHTALMAWVGCHIDSLEQAKWFGDEMALKADVRDVDLSSTAADLAFMVRHIGVGRSAAERARLLVAFLGGGVKDADEMLTTHCAAADSLAEQLGLSDEVRSGIEQSFERWDGRGAPRGARGEEISITARLVNLADVVAVFHRAGGVGAAVDVAVARRGTQFDPALVDELADSATELLADLDGVSLWDTVVADPSRREPPLDDAQLDQALEAVADFADIKSPFTIGHSRGVADLAGNAASTLGLGSSDATDLRRAALLHDLGGLGVSNSIWDKVGALSINEVERIRLHPYLTERSLAASPGLGALGAIAIQHHERLDGSGYPRALRGDSLTLSGRVLAAADVYRAKLEPRPHRPAVGPAEAGSMLRAEVHQGRMDGDAVEAVLRAAGHRPRRRRENVVGLTPREIQVLRLLAIGLSTKQIAHRLGISRKTASNHVEHIYAKVGVGNRALVCLFAAKHGLLDPDDGVVSEAGAPASGGRTQRGGSA